MTLISTSGFGIDQELEELVMLPVKNALANLMSLVENGTKEDRRAAIAHLESEMNKLEPCEQPLRHQFSPGLYGREIFNPAGSLIVTKLFKQSHMSAILKGTLGVITEDGFKTLEAPQFFVTEPGTKRVLFAQTDVIFATIHPNPTDLRDINVLEAGIIAGGFDEVEATKQPRLGEIA